ncbi:invasion protein IagB [Izhakiella australiensis]|uniref:Invasion protein IagB n=1 Tax=Izhakiella australiensis TaxID=1926881 RepID=A0A1S8YRD7_9GAMM|nr:lytic transglycosylase domain-containing protein [Izhakiella australiensis]OON41347.1 invasion protein IagB [Izhakiella australiensis]
MKRWLLFFSLLATTLPALADCWQQAGNRYGIEPELLQAIAIVESGLTPEAINENRDGTHDVGLMQINSRHLPMLKKFNITRQGLINDPCQNVMTGAWILAGNFRQYGYSWEAVGAYNAGTGKSQRRKALRNKYIKKVIPHYLKLKQISHQGT